MSKSIYRGHEVVANDNVEAKVVTRNVVYRGVAYDRTARPADTKSPIKTPVTYRGAKAA